MLSIGGIGSRGFSDAAAEPDISSEKKGNTLPVKVHLIWNSHFFYMNAICNDVGLTSFDDCYIL